MVTPDKLPAALHAVQAVLARSRFLAGEGATPADLYRILDWAELLPALIGEGGRDTTEEFRATLAGLAEEFPEFAGLRQDFDAGVAWPAPATAT